MSVSVALIAASASVTAAVGAAAQAVLMRRRSEHVPSGWTSAQVTALVAAAQDGGWSTELVRRLLNASTSTQAPAPVQNLSTAGAWKALDSQV